MRQTESFQRTVIAAAVVGGLLAWPAAGAAQAVAGDAKAARVTLFGPLGSTTTTALADTGTLGSASDAREASLAIGSVPSVLGAAALSAATIGWPDQAASQASLANLALTVGGIGISADFVMASAKASPDGTGGGSLIDNLSINGAPIAVTGEPNQTISVPGGQVVINEQTVSGAGMTVNALHATAFGVTDVVIASATARVN